MESTVERTTAHIANIKLIGGALCLDFANTVEWHAGDQPQEMLTSYQDLVAWGRHAGVLSGPTAGLLLREGRRHPKEAEEVLREAVALREALYRVFVALAGRNTPAVEDLRLLNEAVSRALLQLRIVPTPGGFEWDWRHEGAALDRVLWPIARSAADLLTGTDLSRLRQCADDRGCGWLFLDRSRNRSRRWCDMSACGNRAKARQHYRRQRGKRVGGTD